MVDRTREMTPWASHPCLAWTYRPCDYWHCQVVHMTCFISFKQFLLRGRPRRARCVVQDMTEALGRNAPTHAFSYTSTLFTRRFWCQTVEIKECAIQFKWVVRTIKRKLWYADHSVVLTWTGTLIMICRYRLDCRHPIERSYDFRYSVWEKSTRFINMFQEVRTDWKKLLEGSSMCTTW